MTSLTGVNVIQVSQVWGLLHRTESTPANLYLPQYYQSRNDSDEIQ